MGDGTFSLPRSLRRGRVVGDNVKVRTNLPSHRLYPKSGIRWRGSGKDAQWNQGIAIVTWFPINLSQKTASQSDT